MQLHEEAEQDALDAAEQWLSLIDAGDFTESWNESATLFRSAISLEDWKTSLEKAYIPLGKPVSRKLHSKRYAEELPGAPDGEYVVIEYQTTFQRKKNGVETVTPMKDMDGVWRVSGYFIK